MSTIDLIVLGIIKQSPMSAYDLQKEVDYRNISSCVKISTPSIYKKVIKLEENNMISSEIVKSGNKPDKTIYSLTQKGEQYFCDLMDKFSNERINIFLDFNSVVMNLDFFPIDVQKQYIKNIKREIAMLVNKIQENINLKGHIPNTGLSILTQQYELALTLEKWVSDLEKRINE